MEILNVRCLVIFVVLLNVIFFYFLFLLYVVDVYL